MNAYEKFAYDHMSNFDRCNLVLGKALELIKVVRLLTDADIKLLDALWDDMTNKGVDL